MDEQLLSEAARKHRSVITIEDGTVVGGLHGVVAEFMSALPDPLRVRAVGIPDEYVTQGTQEELRALCGLTKDAIKAVFAEEMQKNSKKC